MGSAKRTNPGHNATPQKNRVSSSTTRVGSGRTRTGEGAVTVIEEPGVPLPGLNAPPFAIVVLPTTPEPVSQAFARTLVRLEVTDEPVATACRLPLGRVADPGPDRVKVNVRSR
jgi:hypothetical protein